MPDGTFDHTTPKLSGTKRSDFYRREINLEVTTVESFGIIQIGPDPAPTERGA